MFANLTLTDLLWIIGAIGTFIAFAKTITAPMNKLNTTITKLDYTLQSVIESNEKRDTIIDRHEMKIQDHELRLDRLERNDKDAK